MPDESDAGDDPGDVEDATDVDADATDSGATASDATDESTPDRADGDGEETDSAAGTDAKAPDSGGERDDESDGSEDETDEGVGDSVEPDDDSNGSDEDSGEVDEDSGGLRKVEPEIRGDDGDGDEGAESVPNRGVEAGSGDSAGGGEHDSSGSSDAPEDGPGPRPRRHPERPDPGEAKPSDEVPVGHAAGAPKPGEASAAGAGAGGGGEGGTGGGGGAGVTTGQGTGSGTDDVWYDPDDGEDDGLLDGPPDDEEMPLADHIEEMVLRLAAVITVGAVATAIMFLYADRLVVIMWNDILPAGVDAARPHLYGPLEFILTKIKVASLAGILLAVPVLVYQSYLFMRPGLYPKERKYYLAAVPTSLVLATFGMAFAYFLVLPGLFNYFLYYTQGNAEVAFGLAATFNLIVALMALLAVVFQIPLFIMLAIMMGITTRRWLEQRRILFWGAFAGIAFLFAPDPTGMAPFVIAVTMILLFEGTLLLLRWTGR